MSVTLFFISTIHLHLNLSTQHQLFILWSWYELSTFITMYHRFIFIKKIDSHIHLDSSLHKIFTIKHIFNSSSSSQFINLKSTILLHLNLLLVHLHQKHTFSSSSKFIFTYHIHHQSQFLYSFRVQPANSHTNKNNTHTLVRHLFSFPNFIHFSARQKLATIFQKSRARANWQHHQSPRLPVHPSRIRQWEVYFRTRQTYDLISQNAENI